LEESSTHLRFNFFLDPLPATISIISEMTLPIVLPTAKMFSQVNLIPWDPDSAEHVERMVLQRIACGWKQDAVKGWKPRQNEGKMALQWVVSGDLYHVIIL
jgi:hypothetical protein